MAGSICDVVFLSVCSLSAVFVFAFPWMEMEMCVFAPRDGELCVCLDGEDSL